MDHVVTAFLRHRGEVLLVRRSEHVGTYRGRWGGVSGYVEGDPARAERDAAREVREEVGLADARLVRAGDPLTVSDEAGEWTVHPFLYEVDTHEVDPNYEVADWAWVPAPAMRDRETVPMLWEAYRRVAPTVETVAADDEHGSAYLSARALEVLRDEAAVVAGEGSGDWDALAAVARDLRAAHPSMAALATRVDRAMATAEGDPAAVVDAAHRVLGEALDADAGAAAAAAALLGEAGHERVLTLSRSGTVRDALDRLRGGRDGGDGDEGADGDDGVDSDDGDDGHDGNDVDDEGAAGADRGGGAYGVAPSLSVVVAESRPSREGTTVAEELAADGIDVTLTTDAAVAQVFADGAVDAALVGADAVLPDASVVNKVGTRALGLAAAREGVPLYVVAARDKVAADGETRVGDGDAGNDGAGAGDADVAFDPGRADDAALYDGPTDLALHNPLFDRTPADCVAAVVTEDGPLDAAKVRKVADAHRAAARWAAGDGEA